MFTGQLPWNGTKQLGVEQIHSDQELPDPREYATGLPTGITDVLRRVTSANPDVRPRSASEVMQMIYYVFNAPVVPLRDDRQPNESMARRKDAEELLEHGLAQWESSNGKFNLGLTKFALIDLYRKQIPVDRFNRFLLSQALTYGYNDDYWWLVVRDPRERLQVSSVLLGKENEVIAARILSHLTSDPQLLKSMKGLPKNMAIALLKIGTTTNDAILRQKIFSGLRTLIPSGTAWRDPPLPAEQIKRLGVLALEDSEVGDTTAQLIGHIRSPSAIQVVLHHMDEGRKIEALLLIQQVAESLPSFVPLGVRVRLSLEWILQRLTQRPVNLIGAYMMAFLGAALGIGVQVYLTYNLPDFLDIARISTSLEQGLIIGSILGLGIFLTRVITERFHTSNLLLSIFLGTIVGGVGINIALWMFHVLFLNTPPHGFLIPLGCAVIALTFALGGLIRSRLIKMLLSGVSILSAIMGTWLLHINLTTSIVEWTPMFRYAYTWSLMQIAFTAFIVAFVIGILGNMISLSVREEYP
jgi:hypothetical protein